MFTVNPRLSHFHALTSKMYLSFLASKYLFRKQRYSIYYLLFSVMAIYIQCKSKNKAYSLLHTTYLHCDIYYYKDVIKTKVKLSYLFSAKTQHMKWKRKEHQYFILSSYIITEQKRHTHTYNDNLNFNKKTCTWKKIRPSSLFRFES